ncbi:hypothetical protein H6P81_016337 [Aristolochia fimbriata]|uniref:Pectinesterase inhibitor domain-containing protein n=1 Tax=Aristolochia fimbriata TaxID=158543 RepID=A0AAV7E830_ARIFI|nr:hypothetical protein H6P81_016337 [Aristolochia fimbriata]
MGAMNGVVAGALFVAVCFLLPATVPAIMMAEVAAPAPNTVNLTGSSGFVNESCGKTEYPDVCLSTLGEFAGLIHDNPRQLAQMAVSVSLRRGRLSAAYVSYVIHSNSVNDRYAQEVLGDCKETLATAVGQIKDSLGEVRRMTDAGSADFRLRLSNAQTWMSAALSNVDTCNDEFEDAKVGKVKTDVLDRVKRFQKVTANALALVNLCAA